MLDKELLNKCWDEVAEEKNKPYDENFLKELEIPLSMHLASLMFKIITLPDKTLPLLIEQILMGVCIGRKYAEIEMLEKIGKD